MNYVGFIDARLFHEERRLAVRYEVVLGPIDISEEDRKGVWWSPEDDDWPTAAAVIQERAIHELTTLLGCRLPR